MSAKPTSKTFGKSTREVPASTEKAKKWYPAGDDAENKKVSLGDDCDAFAGSCTSVLDSAVRSDIWNAD